MHFDIAPIAKPSGSKVPAGMVGANRELSVKRLAQNLTYCRPCNKTFSMPAGKRDHDRALNAPQQRDPSKYQCSDCDHPQFGRPFELEKHIAMSHDDTQIHACEEERCIFLTGYEPNLKAHIARVLSESDIPCSRAALGRTYTGEDLPKSSVRPLLYLTLE